MSLTPIVSNITLKPIVKLQQVVFTFLNLQEIPFTGVSRHLPPPFSVFQSKNLCIQLLVIASYLLHWYESGIDQLLLSSTLSKKAKDFFLKCQIYHLIYFSDGDRIISVCYQYIYILKPATLKTNRCDLAMLCSLNCSYSSVIPTSIP